MLEPAADVPALWIVVGPMNHTPSIIPFVLAKELHVVPFFEVGYARCKVDVVCNQDGLLSTHAENEALVSTPVVVVGQDSNDLPTSADLQIALSVFVGFSEELSVARLIEHTI